MKNFLKTFSVSAFTIAVGLINVSLVTDMAQNVFQFQFWINRAWLSIGIFIFASVLILYLLKIILSFNTFKDEISHIETLNYFPLMSISFILVSQAFRNTSPMFALILISIGVLIQFVLFLLISSNLFRKKDLNIENLNPSWFIPSIGNLLIPVFANQIFPVYIGWFFFSTGILYLIILVVLSFHSMIFQNKDKVKIINKLITLIAIFSLASLSFYQLTGQTSPTVIFFFVSSFFLFLISFFLIDFFLKLKFDIFLWFYSFSISLLCVSMFFMSRIWGFLKWVSLVILILLNIFTLVLLIFTIVKLIDGKLFDKKEE